MKVYLDNCCYYRLFDDRRNIKNYLEREAVLIVMQKAFDSLHLAAAEAGTNILLTTDIKFLRNCQKVDAKIAVKNPVEFVMEVFDYDEPDHEDI